MPLTLGEGTAFREARGICARGGRSERPGEIGVARRGAVGSRSPRSGPASRAIQATKQDVVQCSGSYCSHAGDYRVSAGRVVLDSDSA